MLEFKEKATFSTTYLKNVTLSEKVNQMNVASCFERDRYQVKGERMGIAPETARFVKSALALVAWHTQLPDFTLPHTRAFPSKCTCCMKNACNTVQLRTTSHELLYLL